MKVHEIKIQTEYLDDINNGIKKFEIRKNDRNYQVGDVLLMTEVVDISKKGTFYWIRENVASIKYLEKIPRHVLATINYITNYAQKNDYVVLGLEHIRIYSDPYSRGEWKWR